MSREESKIASGSSTSRRNFRVGNGSNFSISHNQRARSRIFSVSNWQDEGREKLRMLQRRERDFHKFRKLFSPHSCRPLEPSGWQGQGPTDACFNDMCRGSCDGLTRLSSEKNQTFRIEKSMITILQGSRNYSDPQPRLCLDSIV